MDYMEFSREQLLDRIKSLEMLTQEWIGYTKLYRKDEVMVY